jgi:hypothetical protein
MEKKVLRKTVFSKYLGKTPPKWKDVKNLFEIQDDDFIALFYGGDENENENYSGEWVMYVERDEIESDEAYELRLNLHERWVKEQKEKKYKKYLELKEEFENEE